MSNQLCRMRKYLLLIAILFLQVSLSSAQTCIGTTGIKHGRGLFSFLSYTNDHRIIAGGTYATATQPFFAMDGDTLFPNPGDVLTAFAAILDTNFNLIRMFNVVGFNLILSASDSFSKVAFAFAF